MPAKKSAKGGKNDAPVDNRTDDDILKERRRLEVFALGDYALGALGWGAWVLSGAWFLIFIESAPSTTDDADSLGALASSCMGDPTWLLLVSGNFITSIGRSSPKSAWSWWRKPWHFGWCVVLGVFALAFGALGLASVGRTSKVPTGAAKLIGAVCALCAVAVAMTCPSGPPNPVKSSDAMYGKCVLAVMGLLGMKLGVDAVLGAAWSETVGPAAAAVTALPLFMLSAGAICAVTDAELVAAAFAAILLFVGAGLKAVVVFGGMKGAILPLVGLGVTCSLFVPAPGTEADKNPFNMALCKAGRDFKKMMSQPISGFGDDGEG